MAKMGEVKKRIDELEEERNKKLRYDLLERELNRYRAISAATNLKTIQSEKTSKDKTLNSLNSEIKHLEEERASIRKDASEIRSQKTKFMDEVNAYNKSKSEIETKLSYERRKFDEADSLIKTNTNLSNLKSKNVKLGIRSEFIKIAKNQSENLVDVNVEKVEDLGNYKLITAQMGNFTIKSKVNRETEISGQNVKLHIPPEKCCVYEENKLI